MLDYLQLLLLGAIAGFTIFIGLPVGLLSARPKLKNFLNSLATGILIFILFDVLEYAWEESGGAFEESTITSNAYVLLFLMALGLAIGLIGLALYQNKFMSTFEKKIPEPGLSAETPVQTLGISSSRLSLLIAVGIGVHNLSEGLAIGQSFAQGEISLALILIVGFGLHNATEGFGIVAPMVGNENKPSLMYLAKLGLIGGGPTFLGTLIGSFWVSDFLYVFFLALAAGALIYVILLMNNLSAKNVSIPLTMTGIFIGLMAGFLTDLIITLAGA